MAEDNSARLVGDTLIRDRDGARWSVALGAWVLPRSRQKGITFWVPASNIGNHPHISKTNNSNSDQSPLVLVIPSRVRRKKTGLSVLRIALSEAQNWRCCYCGILCDIYPEPRRNSATIEHVIELSRGGPDNWDNAVMACSACNNERGNSYTAESFFRKKQKQIRPNFY